MLVARRSHFRSSAGISRWPNRIDQGPHRGEKHLLMLRLLRKVDWVVETFYRRGDASSVARREPSHCMVVHPWEAIRGVRAPARLSIWRYVKPSMHPIHSCFISPRIGSALVSLHERKEPQGKRYSLAGAEMHRVPD